MKIGIFGGSFNPIHNSHIYLAEECYKTLSLDLVLFIPTYSPPHKDPQFLAPPKDRLEMCRLACEDYPYFTVEDHEILKGGTSYTYQTLDWLTTLSPNAELFLLMGSDMYLTIKQWKNPARIFELATLCAIAREDQDLAKIDRYKVTLDKEGVKSVILQLTPKPMSSTYIRELISRGEPTDAYLNPKVRGYIDKHNLYK